MAHPIAVGGAVLLLTTAASACGPAVLARTSGAGKIVAVGAESEYGNVIGQIGGRYVSASAIMSDPSTDPHTFEASPQVAQLISTAELVVQNGLGYDAFMNRIEAATPSQRRRVISVQSLLGLPSSTPNPHLWYRTSTMPKVARAVAVALGRLAPSHRGYFQAQLTRFDRSLLPWTKAIAELRQRFAHAPVATTEPVADYLLQAVGLKNRTPWSLQAAVMNGVDPSPQDVGLQDQLLQHHQVRAFLYNEQVTDSLTSSFLALARRDGVPVVAVYETMPSPGYDYQTWMLAETRAVQRALSDKRSTTRL
ncbi:MAG TPA: zinc ABC transporter substrate-binding protein [Candidatus Dormibacteraeota bacterium]